MSSWARPGVKCVCVDADDLGLDSGVLVAGGVYTVRATLVQTDYRGVAEFCIRLNEIVRDDCPITGQADLGFRVDRFRPLITKTQEQDLALFRHLLSPSPVDVGLVPAGVELDA